MIWMKGHNLICRTMIKIYAVDDGLVFDEACCCCCCNTFSICSTIRSASGQVLDCNLECNTGWVTWGLTRVTSNDEGAPMEVVTWTSSLNSSASLLDKREAREAYPHRPQYAMCKCTGASVWMDATLKWEQEKAEGCTVILLILLIIPVRVAMFVMYLIIMTDCYVCKVC